VNHEKVASILDISGASAMSTRVDIVAALPHLHKRYTRGPGIRILDLKGCYSLKEEQLEKLLQLGHATLEKLSLENCIAIRSLDCLKNKPFLATIGSLCLSRCRSAPGLPNLNCPNLHTLNISQSDGILCLNANPNPFLTFLETCTSLTNLDVSGTRIPDAHLEKISSMPALTKLDLKDCSVITSAGVRHLAKLTNLTILDLSWCTGVGDDGVVPIVTKCLNLQSLKLAQLYHITDAICKPMPNLTKLQLLDLEEDFRLSKSGLQNVFQSSSLRFLNLHGVPVDKEILANFTSRNLSCKVTL